MGWIDFILNVGLRISGSEAEIINAIREELKDNKDIKPSLSSLRSTVDVESEYESSDDENSDDDNNNVYLLYFNKLLLDTSNGKTIDTNSVYCDGQKEFYHDFFDEDTFIISSEKRLFLTKVANRLNIEDRLSWSLRARGSWSNTGIDISNLCD